MQKKSIKIPVISDMHGDSVSLKAVLALARKCNYERRHTHHVKKLALRLFDELAVLHQFGSQERFMLCCGALLHDIGWVEGQQGHHKTALRIIMDSPVLRFNFQQRCVIGLIARYHRKAMPKKQHTYFCDLDAKSRDIVRKLASILRIADGLDRTHRNKVKYINCRIGKKQVEIVCGSRESLDAEFVTAKDKDALFEDVFAKKLTFTRETC